MSNEVKHTPGPWAIDRSFSTAINAGKKHITMVNFYNVVDENQRIIDEEHEANAHLIAAAPEMLAALRVVAGSDNWRCFVDEEWDIVNDAIAKATGEQP